MKIRSWALFDSDLPPGEVVDGSEFVSWPGRPVMEAVRGLLIRRGCQVDPPEAEGEHGWSLDIRFEGRSFWCQVTLGEQYYLVLEEISPWRWLLRRPSSSYRTILAALADELASDPRFRNVRWSVEP